MNGDERDDAPPPGDTNGDVPLGELADLEDESDPSFWTRVRNRIERRTAASDITSFWWHVPGLVILEFLDMIFRLFGSPDKPKGDLQ